MNSLNWAEPLTPLSTEKYFLQISTFDFLFIFFFNPFQSCFMTVMVAEYKINKMNKITPGIQTGNKNDSLKALLII